MALTRETFYLDDFKGGLNLTSQYQDLLPSESPDCLNVDFGVRGGFTSRGGFQTKDYDAQWDGASFIGAADFATDKLWVQSANGSLYSWDGTTFTDTTSNVTDDTTYHVHGATMGGALYMANGRLSSAIIMQKWDGTTLTTLANTFNNDYTTPDQGDMPLARYVAQHNGHMFVADTVESSVRYPSRLRWSHLAEPEDWASADYVDIDETDNSDPITGLAPFQGNLVIFKRSSVWVLYGDDRTNFSVERLVDNGGINSHHSAASSGRILYWFTVEGDVFAYDGQRIWLVAESLRWWSNIGKIKHGGSHKLMWSHDRLWLSLEAGSSETVNRWTFVWDPAVGPKGALTRYDPVIEEFHSWQKLADNADPLFLFESDNNLYRWDRSYSEDIVDAGAGGVATRIDAYYRTAWLAAGETATRKRWKRPRLTAAAEGDATLRMRVFHDYNADDVVKSFEWLIDTPVTAVWDTMVWDTDSWSAGADDTYDFRRITSGGTSYAIQYLFSSDDNADRWWIDSIAIPYRRKSVR